MEASSFSIITEFAVAIAGFSGIAIAIAHSGGALPPLDRFRTLNLLTWAMSAAFASTFPLVAESIGISGSAIWRWSSFGFALVLILGILERFVTARALTVSERSTLSSTVWTFTIGGNAVFAVWQLLNVGALIGPASPAPILIGLIWLLAVSSLIFVRLLTIRSNSPVAQHVAESDLE